MLKISALFSNNEKNNGSMPIPSPPVLSPTSVATPLALAKEAKLSEDEYTTLSINKYIFPLKSMGLKQY